MSGDNTRPLRVAMVAARALPFMGGIETHIHEVSRRLAAKGVEVTVLTTDTTGELPVDERMAVYRVRRWPAYPRSRDYYFAPGLTRYLRHTNDFDVAHIQVCTPWYPRWPWRHQALADPDGADVPHRRQLVGAAGVRPIAAVESDCAAAT